MHAELMMDASAADVSLANLRRKLGENALFTRAAAERVRAMRDPSQRGGASLFLF